MPFNAAWLITVVGFVIAFGVWAKTKRIIPAVLVFLGGILIMAFADPTTLTNLGTVMRNLINTGVNQGINNGG